MHIAYEQYLQFRRAFPDSKDAFKSMQNARLHAEDSGAYDLSVFCPSEYLKIMIPSTFKHGVANALARGQKLDDNVENFKMAREFWGTHVLGTWRQTLGIYKIDPTFYPQLIQSDVPEDTPSDVFKRFNQWCVYIETPDVNIVTETGEFEMAGFWALVDADDTGMLFLHIVKHIPKIQSGMIERSADACFQPIRMPLVDGFTIKDLLQDYYQHHYKWLGFENLLAYNSAKNDIKELRRFLSLLLWLCVEEPDLTDINNNVVDREYLRMHEYRRHKKTGAYIPPSSPTFFNIGKRLGGEIRQFNNSQTNSNAKVSSKKRPHIRKGHWHGYWKGQRENKKFDIRWQPAIFVNAH